MKFTALVQPDTLPSGAPMFVALCVELDIASQGENRKEALDNLREAVAGFLEVADDAEVGRRLKSGASVEEFKVAA
jgi:predicted RNase H-like HicB family nuclease